MQTIHQEELESITGAFNQFIGELTRRGISVFVFEFRELIISCPISQGYSFIIDNVL